MKKNILILGGLGFIGQNLIEVLIDEYDLVVYDRQKLSKNQNFLYYTGDFTKKEDLERVFKENKIDLVIHSISTTIPSSDNIVHDINSNLFGTINLLELMKMYSVPKILFISSGGTVYGLIDKNSIDENYPTDPICSHGINKLAIEKYIYLYHHLYNIDYLILRLSNPFGEYHTSDKQGLINVILKKIIKKEKITIWGDGGIIRDYIYIKDCAKIIHELIKDNISNQLINVGSGQGHSINEILAIIRNCVGNFEIANENARNFDVPKIVLDISKLKSLIKFQLTPIEEGINNTYKWLKSKYE
ncbi:MAG: NAD-dependent epimerase/dehydratase family protein [Patescibacteria group bacterium]